MARRKPASTLSDQLREFIREEMKEGSAYELAREADVDRSVLSRFLAGERTITLETADKLAGRLRLRLAGRGRQPAP
jgi:plasmid maintenance system antidote protein VapI